MSRKRNANKNAWSRRRQTKGKLPPTSRNESPIPRLPQRVRPPLPVPDQPTELDQVGVLIVEEQLGLTTTDLDGLRAFARELPFEPSMSLLALLAGRVEAALSSPTRQLKLAESFFGRSELTSSYAVLVRNDPKAYVFGPQSLYTLMRVLIEEAYDAPIDQALTTEEKVTLMRAVIASNSVTERGTDTGVGPTSEDLLAYELQVGHYYSRPAWMEEMTRARELYMLATEDEELLASPDLVPVAEWISRVGITAEQQWALGFALSSTANAWDSNKHPHVPSSAVDELLARATLAERKEAALGAMAATRAGFQQAFADLAATGKRFIWELRPFSSFPLLRLEDDGLLLLGRPWMLSWLSEGFHYRAMRGAQADDVSATNGRTDHVQRYTAYAGQAFEQYCLRLAKAAFVSPVMVLGEQAYGKGGGQKTTDVAVLVGDDLILFEANARRVGAEPLLTGDPLDATAELTKLLVKKINQLGVAVGALLDGKAHLSGVDMTKVSRIVPVVVSAGRLWQTSHLWTYLDGARDAAKCASFTDRRVLPLQALDGGEYEKVLALAAAGGNLGELLADKATGPFRHRDMAVWMQHSRLVTDPGARLPAVQARFQAMADELVALFGIPPTDPRPEQP